MRNPETQYPAKYTWSQREKQFLAINPIISCPPLCRDHENKLCLRFTCPLPGKHQPLSMIIQTWNLSKNWHCRIFRLKILHHQFHLISTVLVGNNTKNEWKWRNLHRWQKFYTAAGTDGTDKFQLWAQPAHNLRFIATKNCYRYREM